MAHTIILPLLVMLAACGEPADGAAGMAVPDTTASILITGAFVVDGTGAPGRVADVAVVGDRIAAVGDLDGLDAAVTIDGSGLVLAPGFIDIHSHATSSSIENSGVVERPLAENYLRQGVTTVIGGQDGSSPLDIGAALAYLDQSPAAINVGLMIGHGSVRAFVVGADDREATADEIDRMTEIVRRAMRDGAFGITSGLEYTPGQFASTEELIAVSRPAGEVGALHSSHIRDEGGKLLESVAEIIRVGEESGARPHITHHKVVGKGRWGLSAESLALIEQARGRGVDAGSDVYPYTASSTGLTILFPAWAKDGGFERLQQRLLNAETRSTIRRDVIDHINAERGADPSTIVAARCNFDRSFDGKSLADILRERGLEATVPNSADVAIELVLGGSCSGVFHSMSEQDVAAIMSHPTTMISSDGGIPEPGSGVPHPRNYGAFARVLAKYVRTDSVLTLHQAVHKMTRLSAERLGLSDRGVVRPGAVADLVLFDPAAIEDTARFGDPHHMAEGVHTVVVSGVRVLADGRVTGLRPGKALRFAGR
ncbi:MAG: D-aminoacylase [Rhodothermales bacterium]|nr:D-aminoacylase [Rhodothermales bacterium]